MHDPATPARRRAGFTLVEALAAIAIAATLSTIALPSIERQLLRMRRVDAYTAMLAVQLAQERWRSNEPAYATLADIGIAATTAGGHYRLAIQDNDRNGYRLIASATGPQSRDTACRELRIRVVGPDVRYASGPDEGTTNGDTADRKCWNR